jgi:hypothetical protein
MDLRHVGELFLELALLVRKAVLGNLVEARWSRFFQVWMRR